MARRYRPWHAGRRIRQCGRASSVRYFGTVPGGILDAFGRRLRSRNLPTFFLPPHYHCLMRSRACRSVVASALPLSRSRPFIPLPFSFPCAAFLSPAEAPDGAPAWRWGECLNWHLRWNVACEDASGFRLGRYDTCCTVRQLLRCAIKKYGKKNIVRVCTTGT